MILHIQKTEIDAAKKDEISMEYQTNSIGLSRTRVKYQASGALIKITRKAVMISMGVPCPIPSMTLLLVMPIVTKGKAKTKI